MIYAIDTAMRIISHISFLLFNKLIEQPLSHSFLHSFKFMFPFFHSLKKALKALFLKSPTKFIDLFIDPLKIAVFSPKMKGNFH
jgi:hypothetical protein